MRCMTLFVLLVACAFTAMANAADQPSGSSLGDLSRAGDKPLTTHEWPESLAEKILKALKDPAGKTMRLGGGGGDRSDAEFASGRVESPSTAGEVLDAYSRQLLDAGWIAVTTHDDGAVAFASWHFTESSGQRWHALLVVEQSFERPAEERNIELRLTRLPADPK